MSLLAGWLEMIAATDAWIESVREQVESLRAMIEAIRKQSLAPPPRTDQPKRTPREMADDWILWATIGSGQVPLGSGGPSAAAMAAAYQLGLGLSPEAAQQKALQDLRRGFVGDFLKAQRAMKKKLWEQAMEALDRFVANALGSGEWDSQMITVKGRGGGEVPAILLTNRKTGEQRLVYIRRKRR